MQNINEIIDAIQNGSNNKNEVIERFKPKILYWASNYCKRSLDWSNDDELSIALIAFNEAIDSYEIQKGSSFLTYAKVVVKHKLIDYFKKEYKHRHLSLTIENEEDFEFTPAEIILATENYYKELDRRDRAEELQEFQQILIDFGMSLTDLAKNSPKHKDTRRNLNHSAKCLVSDINLVEKLKRTKRIPINELKLKTGLSKKVLETGRKYIIAVSLILLNNEFEHLRSFIGLGGDVNENQSNGYGNQE